MIRGQYFDFNGTPCVVRGVWIAKAYEVESYDIQKLVHQGTRLETVGGIQNVAGDKIHSHMESGNITLL